MMISIPQSNFLRVIFFLFAFAIISLPRVTQAQVGGGISVFDWKVFPEAVKTVQGINEQIRQLEEMLDYQKQFQKAMGEFGIDQDTLNLLGLIADIACGRYQLPQFSYWYNLNFRLPVLPPDPCTLAQQLLPSGNLNLTNWHTATGTLENAFGTTRKLFFADPNQNGGNLPVEEQLRLRNERQKGLRGDVINANAVGEYTQTSSANANKRLNDLVKAETKNLRGDVRANTAAIAAIGEQNTAIIVLLSSIAKLEAKKEMQDLDMFDPFGSDGRPPDAAPASGP